MAETQHLAAYLPDTEDFELCFRRSGAHYNNEPTMYAAWLNAIAGDADLDS